MSNESIIQGKSFKFALDVIALYQKLRGEREFVLFWLRLLQESSLVTTDVTGELAQAEELIRILTSIVKTTVENPDPNSELITHNS